VARRLSTAFPYGTLLINITGSLIVGFFLVFSTERVLLDPRWRLLVVIGFCGSYTTFSSYAFESFALMEQGQWLLTGINIVASNALCLAAVLAGAALARGL
jgi:CrcB protein